MEEKATPPILMAFEIEPINNNNDSPLGYNITAPPGYDDLWAPRKDLQGRIEAFMTQPHRVIMLVLGFIAITINILSLFALFHIRNRLNSHYRLIISLSISDLLVGVSILLYVTNKVINPIPVYSHEPYNNGSERCTFIFLRALNTTALNISLLNLMGMSIDHYLAINKPLHYPKLMNLQRVRLMICILWVAAFLCGYLGVFASIFWYHELKHENNTYCHVALDKPFHEEFITMGIAAVCLFVMVFIYTKIYRTVSQRMAPGVRHQVKSEERRNRRALITTLLILGSFVLCWIPGCLFQIIMIISVKNTFIERDLIVKLVQADYYFFDLLLLNSICDPIIYTVRTYEVQLGYRRMFSACFKRPYLDRKRCSNTTQSSLLKPIHTKSIRVDTKTNDYVNSTAL